jgi:hypothetical protein
MWISWTPGRGPRCTDHGYLAGTGPLEHHDAGILALEHLRDAHGNDPAATADAITTVRSHKQAAAAA